MVISGTFREDLYYRLNVVNIELVPLRDREDDSILFTNFFLDRLNSEYKTMVTISEEALICLKNTIGLAILENWKIL